MMASSRSRILCRAAIFRGVPGISSRLILSQAEPVFRKSFADDVDIAKYRLRLEQDQGSVQCITEVDPSAFRRLRSGIDQQVLDGHVEAVDLVQNLRDDLLVGMVLIEARTENLNRSADSGEGIFYFVRERSRELPDRGQVLGFT